MKKYKVVVEVYLDRNRVERKEVIVEAGNKKMASLRALGQISKEKGYVSLYKSVKSVEEAA